MRRPALSLAGPLLATVGAAVVVGGSFLPWLRSGRRDRSSYEMYGLARRLGFAHGSVARTAVAVWPVVPVVAIGAVVAIWAGLRSPGVRWTGTVVSAVCGLYVVAICVVAWRAPLPARFGVTVTAVGAVGLAVAPAALATWRRP